MATTTPLAIRRDFVAVVGAIVPAHAEYAFGWNYVPTRRAVQGAATPRTYTIEFLPADAVMPTDGGIWGDGQQRVAVFRVWTSYAGLAEEHDDSIISEDTRQLFIALDARKEPAVPGLWYVEELGWADDPDGAAPGHRFGAHEFRAHYHASAAA